jgi:hypothetical protein
MRRVHVERPVRLGHASRARCVAQLVSVRGDYRDVRIPAATDATVTCGPVEASASEQPCARLPALCGTRKRAHECGTATMDDNAVRASGLNVTTGRGGLMHRCTWMRGKSCADAEHKLVDRSLTLS